MRVLSRCNRVSKSPKAEPLLLLEACVRESRTPLSKYVRVTARGNYLIFAYSTYFRTII